MLEYKNPVKDKFKLHVAFEKSSYICVLLLLDPHALPHLIAAYTLLLMH